MIELKSGTGNAKNANTALIHPEKQHIIKWGKLGDYSGGRNEKTLTLPLYMGFLLN